MTDDRFEGEWEGVNKKSRAGLIALGVAAVIFVIFILSNTADVDIEFIGLSFTMPEWLMFTILFLLGMVFGWAASSLRRRSKMKAARDDR